MAIICSCMILTSPFMKKTGNHTMIWMIIGSPIMIMTTTGSLILTMRTTGNHITTMTTTGNLTMRRKITYRKEMFGDLSICKSILTNHIGAMDGVKTQNLDIMNTRTIIITMEVMVMLQDNITEFMNSSFTSTTALTSMSPITPVQSTITTRVPSTTAPTSMSPTTPLQTTTMHITIQSTMTSMSTSPGTMLQPTMMTMTTTDTETTAGLRVTSITPQTCLRIQSLHYRHTTPTTALITDY